MQEILILVIALIWLAGTLRRIYKQAHYYQIEEYMSPRYLRWLFQERMRWLPSRPIAAWFIGSAIATYLGEAPGSILPHILTGIAAIIAVLPPKESEVKKAFVRTQRATRMLATAFFTAIVSFIILLLIINTLPLPDIAVVRIIIVSAVGLLLFLLAPLWLVLGNIFMIPVEAIMRRRFLQRAETVLQAIQPTIIGITGSYGKTTTKHFLRDILSSRYRVYATPKSYNTLMGISLAINQDMTDDYSIEYFISEMGAYVPGEIERICQLTPPSIGIITEVGPQHLERFGSLENTATAKYELIKGLPPDGIGIFNWDNPYVREMADRGYPNNRIVVSKQLTKEEAVQTGIRYLATDIQETIEGLSFTVIDIEKDIEEPFHTPVIGEHNVINLLLATATAIQEGMALKDVAHCVRSLQPAESRLVRHSTANGITIINDAYSANPVGAISALKVLGLHQTGKRLLITPGMIELGDRQDIENHQLGQKAAEYATDVILIGGKQTATLKAGLLEVDFPADHLQVVQTLGEAVGWYQQNLQAGDTVLFLNDLPDTY